MKYIKLFSFTVILFLIISASNAVTTIYAIDLVDGAGGGNQVADSKENSEDSSIQVIDKCALNCPDGAEIVPDFTCVLSKILNTPTSGEEECCESKCSNEEDVPKETINSTFYSLKIFNTSVEISYEKLPTLINLGFSTFLAIIAIYAAIRGIYIFAIKMPNATNDEELASISKEARAIVIGFILSLSFLFITQLVFNILGLPNLSDLQLDVNPDTGVEGSKIVIQ